MPISSLKLLEWSNAALEWFKSGSKNYVHVDGLQRSDIEYASDVANLMPMLYLLTKNYNGMRNAPVFIEIGTADGSTTIPLVKAAAELGGHLHSVDPDHCKDAHRLVKHFGYDAHWTHHQMPSDHFFKTFDQPIDFAFIDGDHRWPVVERDIANCYKLLNPGCMIWPSDYGQLHEGFPNYEHEYVDSEYKEHVQRDPLGDNQMSNGVAKAAYRLLQSLDRATSILMPIYPNPSLIIRKLGISELDPLKKNIFV